MLQQKENLRPGSLGNEDWMKSGAKFESNLGLPPESQPRIQSTKNSGFNFGSNRINKKDLIYFVGQLAIMFDTGLNIMTALECLSTEAKNPSLQKLVTEIKDSIAEGNPLWIAMKQHPKTFDPICVSMVRAGESSGAMGKMLTRLETYLEQQNDIRIRVQAALSYPVAMMIFSVAVLIFLLSYIFPKFEVMFKDKQDSLPLPTKFFMAISNLFVDYWFIIAPVALIVIGAAIWCWLTEEIRKQIDPLLLKIPLLNTVLMRLSMSRSLHTLSLMLQGGIPVLSALNMARDVAGNKVFEDTWSKVAFEVENGRDLTTPLKLNKHIPRSEVQMITMGDRSGQLPVVLSKLSARYEKEIDTSVKGLIRLIEPALVISMGFMVGLIVLSLILPIFAMSRIKR